MQIGSKRGKKRKNDVGVLQGSGLSPTLFMIYFLRGCQAVRTCEKCKEEMSTPSTERRSRCEECGKVVTHADDLTAIHRAEGKRNNIVEKVEEQGRKIDMTLKSLGLAMNMGKTQFIAAMNYQ